MKVYGTLAFLQPAGSYLEHKKGRGSSVQFLFIRSMVRSERSIIPAMTSTHNGGISRCFWASPNILFVQISQIKYKNKMSQHNKKPVWPFTSHTYKHSPPVHGMNSFSHCLEWRMACHGAKQEDILVQIEKKKREMENREGKNPSITREM